MKCGSCKYWSEMLAMNDGAMCLVDEGPQKGKYVPKWHGCDKHEEGMPVDLDCVPAGQRDRSVAFREDLMGD
jgi:hypothetical protein